MERYAFVIFFLFLQFLFFELIVIVRGLGSSSQLVPAQKNAMIELSRELPFLRWNAGDGKSPCEWKGVFCSSSSSSSTRVVTHLSLSSLGLSTSSSARLFDLLCQLSSLQSLDLSNNSFSSIPNSFFYCKGLSRLKSLNFSCNRLVGSLGNFSAFAAMETLDLSFNNLEGAVSFQLNGIEQLKSLNLCVNSFNGTVPMVKAKGLEKLALSHNRFHGGIPKELLSYDNLTFLDLSQNRLNGSIPVEIRKLSKLETLLLSSNNLDGEIPIGLSKIKNLSRFVANLNKFNGLIPPGFASHLQFFDLSYNNLSGPIPTDLLSSSSLQTVDLTANHLQGPIPKNLSKNLYRLMLGENSFNGNIPAEIGKLYNLTYLELNGNQLDGEIPQDLMNCKNLALLNLAKNNLRGGLPRGFGNLEKLVIMNLQYNKLTGEILIDLSNLAKLITLDLSHNSFAGSIPPSVSNLAKLQILNLEDNELTGLIPTSLYYLPSIFELKLGKNKLRGTIPRMPISLSSVLNLSSNHLNGVIPYQLSELIQLEILDLSNNDFTGQVPNSFSLLQSLIDLVLSNNPQLSGKLPALNPKTVIDFSGTGINKSASNQGAFHRKRKSNTVILIVVIASVIAGFAIIAMFFVLIVLKKFDRIEDEVLQSEESQPPQIVNGHFITYDSIHKANIDMARAMEVVGNTSNIMLKTRFSTYYKAAMPNGRSYSIKKLNWNGKSFPMGSHEKFGKELGVLGKLSNSNIMVPLGYVLTEGSAYLFYENLHKGTVFDFLHKGSGTALDWPSRYSIALGVAQGLAFLHNCNQPVILLDLSTKSIHLKSIKEPQIGDIELFKVLDPSKRTGSFSIVAGSVGYVPPEYAYTMRVTMTGNVYSFGVVLLELLTGKLPISNGLELAKWALSYSPRLDDREKLLDSNICGDSLAVRSQMLSVLKIALSCVSLSPEGRPKTRNLLRMLFNAR